MSIDALRWAKSQVTGSATRKAVLMAIADYADEHGVAWPSQERISADTELSERSVRGAIGELEAQGLLVRRTRRREDGTRNTDRIFLSMNRNRQDVPVDEDQPANGAETTGKRCQNHRQIASKPPAAPAGKPSVELPVGNPHQNHHGSEAIASGPAAADPPKLSLVDELWLEGPAALMGQGVHPKTARSMVGRWLRDRQGDAGSVRWAIEEACRAGSGDPVPYVTRLLSDRPSPRASPQQTRPSNHGALALLARSMGISDAPQHTDQGPRYGTHGAHPGDVGPHGEIHEPARGQAGRFSPEATLRLVGSSRR